MERDSLAIEVAKRLESGEALEKLDKMVYESLKQVGDDVGDESDLSFLFVKPNEDLPFVGEKMVVILDVVEGIEKVTVLTEGDLDRLVLPPRSSAHEYDLGFQLKYLRKLEKIGKVRIVGLPREV